MHACMQVQVYVVQAVHTNVHRHRMAGMEYVQTWMDMDGPHTRMHAATGCTWDMGHYYIRTPYYKEKWSRMLQPLALL